MSDVTRILVVDDQTVVREGLVLLLELLPGIEVAGSAGDGAAALAMVGELRPDVVLMDLRMPRVDRVAATRLIREAHPDVEVVVLTTYADDESIFAALRAGARGYLTKDAGAEEIAGDLCISEATVRTHINNLFAKANLRGRAQAVTYAFRHDLAP